MSEKLIEESEIKKIEKEILDDINNIFKKHLDKKRPETTFILEGELFNSFELIYKLCDLGIINLDHDSFEKNGVTVIL